MKHLFLGLLLSVFCLAANAQLKTPAPSTSQTIKQGFGLSSIELSYSRPNMKGRKIFGGLVPYGKVWRTGANAATTLTFEDDVIIGGKTIPAGKYGLLTIPNKTNWDVIISKQTNVNNPSLYKQEEDMVRVAVKVNTVNMKAETFTMQFANVKDESCDLIIRWDNVKIAVPIKTDVDSKVMASIDEAMKGEKPPYFQAGVYYLNNNKNLKKAEEWLGKAVEAQPDAFWVQHQYAKVLAKNGKKSEAKKVALASKDLAVKAKNADYVKLNDDLIAGLK
ncbi:MAG: DUF2911 domain-containing protein [Niabella sp.]